MTNMFYSGITLAKKILCATGIPDNIHFLKFIKHIYFIDLFYIYKKIIWSFDTKLVFCLADYVSRTFSCGVTVNSPFSIVGNNKKRLLHIDKMVIQSKTNYQYIKDIMEIQKIKQEVNSINIIYPVYKNNEL